jgi:transposase
MDRARAVRPGPGCAAKPARGDRSAGLVTRARRLLAGRGEKGGAQVARTLQGKPGSRFHLAVDKHGAPLAVLLSAGNDNERRYLLPLIDELLARGLKPDEVCADRGFDSDELRSQLWARGIESDISKRRRPGEPIPPGTPTRTVRRGRRKTQKTRDPNAHKRFPIERSNAWLKARRRVATRRDRKPDNYLAFLRLAMILILSRLF